MSTQRYENLASNLSRTARLIRHRLDERLSPLGLTQSRWLILLLLSKFGGNMPQKDIAECVGAEGPTIVRLLDALERMGFIERRGQHNDRRAKIVTLTPQAASVLAEIMRITREFRQELWAGISEEDLAAHERVIAAVQQRLNMSCPKQKELI